MNKLSKFFLVLVVLLLLSAGLLYYVFNAKIKDQIVPQTKAFIQEQTKLKVDFNEFRMSFSQLLKLKPSIKVTDLTVEDALKVRLILVQFNLLELLQRKITIDQVLIDGADISLVENASREVHLKGLKPVAAGKTEASDAPALSFLETLQLKKLSVKNSRLGFQPHGMPNAVEFKPVDLELNDLAVSKDKNIKAKFKLSAQMLDSSRTGIKASGELGPIDFSFASIPIQGLQSFDFYLSDIPDAKKVLGELVRLKKQTLIHQESEFSGDLMKKIKGEGQLKIDKLAIGKSEKHKLDVIADLPHSYTLRLLKQPVLKLESLNSSLELKSQDQASGKLSFDTYIMQDLDTGLLQGSSHGSLSGLELHETLNSLTDFKDLIAGKFAINDYHLSFKGRDAKQLANSLKARGNIVVGDGSLYILKSLTKYKDIAASLLGASKGGQVLDKIGGEFVSLSTDFNLRHGDLFTKPVELKTKALTITGDGVIEQGRNLKYQLALNVPGIRSVPLKLRGTIEIPKVIPDVAKLGKEQGERLINGALKMGLDALIKHAK
ncbi:MAG: hypothetical protein OXU45_08580 [Candidatus Melainabacteria bacterium]|nr:hypothetical protein [Candidatus Melainabacteria bacterium]